MATPLEQFAAECRTILRSEPGPSGRRQICRRLEELLRDRSFVTSVLKESTPEREVLYEDPELGFCVLAHRYQGAKTSPPHDHGPSWAIYGQAAGETEMTDYERIAEPADGKPGRARPIRTYKLTPGVAYLYNERDLHSPRRDGPTELVRIEGMNMDRVKRAKFETVADPERFAAQLKAAGYPEIRTNEYKANQHNPEHEHPFDVHALVLEGEISLTVEGKKTRYGVGDEFKMAAGCRHIEDIGPQGVRYIVGRWPK